MISDLLLFPLIKLSNFLFKEKTDYNAVEYWNKRNNPNSASKHNTEKHVTFIKKNLINCRRLLDFGPGIGRTLEAYESIKFITGYDISDAYAERLYGKAQEMEMNFELIVEKDIKRLPFKDREFDCCVCCSVLLHQTPYDIDLILKELGRVARKVIVISYFDPNFPRASRENHNSAFHCFNYDYFQKCWELNLQILKYEVDISQKQIYFIYRRKP